jgi:protein AroM
MTDDMRPVLGDVELVEHGALDGLAAAAARALGPADADEVLVTRLADGSTVSVAHAAIVPLVEQAVARAEDDGVAATLIVCTGSFPEVKGRGPVLYAERLLTGGVDGIVGAAPLGALCPDPRQVSVMESKWRGGREVVARAASPYLGDPVTAVAEAAKEVRAHGAEFVVLDCMGYSSRMKAAAESAAGIPVLLARTLVARLAGEVAGR